jgi:hypothetical protein
VVVTETWEGDIDLHQGDRGTVSFTRAGSAITGRIRVLRNELPQEHSIDGTWSGDQVRFTRHLSSTSIQPFEGTASQDGPDHVTMSGRFAANLAGEWSAECRRTGSSPKAGPSLERRITPYHPTERDQITFSAVASHSSGVRDVTHVINGAVARSCPGDRCIHVAGPFPAGTITWLVSARSNDGGEQPGHEHTIVITPVSAGTCRLRCRATGPQADRAPVFFVVVSRSDDPGRSVATKPFTSAGTVEFDNLPEGRFRLRVDSRADIAVRARPTSQEVTCQEGQLAEARFEFS